MHPWLYTHVTFLAQRCTHNRNPNALQALCLACGSDPEKGTQKKLGSYLMKTCFQTSTVSRCVRGRGALLMLGALLLTSLTRND